MTRIPDDMEAAWHVQVEPAAPPSECSTRLTILTGRKAIHCLASKIFQSKWKTLCDVCPWATAYQHPDFVAPWYELYYPTFSPVVIAAEGVNGSLEGLLTLALHQGGSSLTGAGERQAEYQAWLQAPGMDGSFIVGAIQEVRARFPGVDLFLKYLPPGIPLEWMDEAGDHRRFCVLRTHPRPIMRADPAAMARQRNKKNHRQNYNRLKRLGTVEFERVVQHDHFRRVFDDMCVQYDFRQAALHRNMPFATDPAKKPFYLELHKRGLLHTTILTVGGAIAASHIGLVSERRAVHLGINTHDPAFAAHSPGNLLLAMLGVHLAAEEMPVLDLTPGGDRYKEHFATEHDSVGELMIYGGTPARLKTEALLGVRRLLKAALRMSGYRTADVLRVAGKLKRLGPSGVRELAEKLRVPSARQHCVLQHRPDRRAVTTTRLPVSRNCLRNILKFDADGSAAKFWHFAGTVMQRMERTHHLFTFVQDDRLGIFCWAAMPGAELSAQTGEPGAQCAASSGQSIVLYDLYVHRRLDDEELIQSFIDEMLIELSELKPGATVFYRGVLDTRLQSVVERCGFVDAGPST